MTRRTSAPFGGPKSVLQRAEGLFPYPRFSIGDRVVITKGMTAGLSAVVLEPWPRTFSGVPQWVVGSDDLVRRRVVRADYLKLEGEP